MVGSVGFHILYFHIMCFHIFTVLNDLTVEPSTSRPFAKVDGTISWFSHFIFSHFVLSHVLCVDLSSHWLFPKVDTFWAFTFSLCWMILLLTHRPFPKVHTLFLWRSHFVFLFHIMLSFCWMANFIVWGNYLNQITQIFRDYFSKWLIWWGMLKFNPVFLFILV